MREGRYKEAEVTYLRLLELMRDQKLADADTLLLAKVGRPVLRGIFCNYSIEVFGGFWIVRSLRSGCYVCRAT